MSIMSCLRSTLVVFGVSGLVVGCAADDVSQVGDGPREDIAYAATAKYPTATVDDRAESGTARAEVQPARTAGDVDTDAPDTRVEVRPGGESTVVEVRRPSNGRTVTDSGVTVAAAPERVSPYRLAAVDDRGDREIEVLNLSDMAIPASAVWVNGLFVHRIPAIAQRGSAKVKYDELLQAGRPTNDLKQLNQPVRKIEVQIDNRLHPVDGPSVKK